MAIINKFPPIPMGQPFATINNGMVRNTGFTVEDLATALSEYVDAYFLVKNEDTGETIVGKLGETMGQHLGWKKAGHKVLVTKLNKETALTLYGKK